MKTFGLFMILWIVSILISFLDNIFHYNAFFGKYFPLCGDSYTKQIVV